ncbi:phospholipid-translocating ATPase [Cryptococcus wingfieldii CBS 7118]|uniref:Phospholipid-transporting ATPase n=1 Tax=Cryptococcus wingfieldii CBS 7118 TaxID=1295528 RepID=A0A1E3JWE0_9TREE|nr:phospholipid-translocating ATPase [Cryptococcus wingfieldii CBS 7118]ODO05178.1 phospholipid-translocating ATPase [Cryptococcus wingfieldii CBS 7118]
MSGYIDHPLNHHASSTTHLAPYPPSHSYFDQGDSDNDEAHDTFDPQSIDPELRLRTVKTAHSVIAESIRSEAMAEKREKRRRIFKTMKRKASGMSMGTLKRKSGGAKSEAGASVNGSRRDSITTDDGATAVEDSPPPPAAASLAPPEETPAKGKGKVPQRRSVHVNTPLPSYLLDKKGEPSVRYVRNKVRTSKYTIISFLPKNLLEQFRRVANIYFLFLVIIQTFPIFGTPNAQIGVLPLIAFLTMTAIKDGFEDWRRSKLDDEVNNSATTKLGGWTNVNQPTDPRTTIERIFGIMGPNPNKPSKGVRKLREREAAEGNQIVFDSHKDEDLAEEVTDKDSFPLASIPAPVVNVTAESPSGTVSSGRHRQSLLPRVSSSSLSSVTSRKSAGVMDWSRQAPGSAQWERTLWKKLEVGDLVLLRDNEQVPADIIVLSTSTPDALCFVETKNLDGETNLKIRRALKATSSIQTEEDLEHAHFVVDSEAPHANLYSYNGVLRYTPADSVGKASESKQEAITINELLLRGCTLRNTKWVIGMVVFTGGDSKIMMNGGETPSKRSKIEKETNFNVIMNFVILVVLCLVTAILHGWYRSLTGTSAEWYEPDAEASNNIYLDSVVIFFSCLLVFQNIVPISLYITVEIVKTIQAYFIFQDVEMYYEPYDTPCVPKTWNISDDLGQIEYVFSDKTGTLTQNIMEFKKCSIQGVPYGEGLTEAMMGARKRDGEETGPAMEDQEEEMEGLKAEMLQIMKGGLDNRYLREDKLTLISPELAQHLANPSDPRRAPIIDFFRALAICHSVLADAPEASKPYELDYKAESPDEAALVAAARDIGFPFVTKNNHSLDIEVLGTPERWTPLRMLEFNSSRKRMSVVARGPDGRLVLFCKGADSVIYGRLADDHDEALKESTLKDLETFANGGLRTLCIAYRYMPEEEFDVWSKKYDAASAATVDREAEIEKACELVEHSLTILGATALEDKLQEGVPDAIALLHQAGIKLWILTGDKLQTAVEIGYSCNLLTNDMEVMIISADSEDGARQQIEAGLNKIASIVGPPPTAPGGSRITRPGMNIAAEFAVVIDGESLRYALQPSLKSLFLSLGTQCAAVICCRVSPSQKALTVRLVKEGCNAMTLSIGDGANDVAMIQEANVGIGLYGLEGSQAAMSADYAFGQFRFLTRLLLVHGRWSYVRVANMHANFFYKNVIWTVSMFWFLIFSSFDATYLFEYTFILMFNLFFTSLPVGIMGAFDQDVHATAAMYFPQLYKRGIAGLEYTRFRFWTYMIDGLYQSAVIFFIPYFAYAGGVTWSSDGLDTNSLGAFGSTVACAGVIAANGYVSMNTRYWTVVTWAVNVISTLLIYIWIPIYSGLAAYPYNGQVSVLYTTFNFWAVTVLTVFVAIFPRWLVFSFKQSYLPKDKDLVREAWIAGSLKDELGIKHRKERRRHKRAAQAATSKERVEQSMRDFSDNYSSAETQSRPGSFRGKGAVDQFHKSYGHDDYGGYQPAAMYSPQREVTRSPLMSEEGTPRGLYSYPPSPANAPPSDSPSRPSRGDIPPPLTLRTTFDPGHPSPLIQGYTQDDDSSHRGALGSPMEVTSLSSMRGVEAQIEQEVKRMKRTSQDFKQASLNSEDGWRTGRGGSDPTSPVLRGGSLGRLGRPSRKLSTNSMGNSSRKTSNTPLEGVDELGRSTFSHVRGTFDIDAQHQQVFANSPRNGSSSRGESQRGRRNIEEYSPYSSEHSSRQASPQIPRDLNQVPDLSDESASQWNEETETGRGSSKQRQRQSGVGFAI